MIRKKNIERKSTRCGSGGAGGGGADEEPDGAGRLDYHHGLVFLVSQRMSVMRDPQRLRLEDEVLFGFGYLAFAF